jgi:hypothetical protein
MTLNLKNIKRANLAKRISFVIGLLFLTNFTTIGQNDYQLFKFYEPYKYDSIRNFYVAVDNVNFFKNNEYKSEFATGYTLTGAWLRPKIVYYPDKKLRMELGGNVLKYNGRDEYYHLSPWFNVHYQPTEKISFILGNLNSDQNHNLPEFLADPEKFLTSKPEAGFQARYNSQRFTADLWIDWQQFIVNGDPFKERFAFGAVANWKIFEKDLSNLSFPLAFYGMHQGGEIDNAPGLAKSFITVTPGLSFNKKVSSKMLKSWSLNSNYSISTYPNDDSFFNASKGWGFYASGAIESRLGGFTLAYWRGHQYYTPQGASLYQNLSTSGTRMITENKLLNLKYHYCHEIFTDTFFGFVFDYYYDTINKRTLNSEALYLIVNLGILKSRLK